MTEALTRVGPYELLGSLGQGGMAEIFLAREHGAGGFHQPVVIKRIRPELAYDSRFVEMFLDEARLIAALRHPNIVGIHDLRDDDGLYMVMEYLEGESVASLERRLVRRRGVPLSAGLTAHLATNVCAALSAAHELRNDDDQLLGIVHRDVSPENIIITYDGHIKLLDFGIAWMRDRASVTEAGQIKGKYAYMAPEQAHGTTVDARTDLFSLGIVLWELSTGQRLFKRPSQLLTLQALCEEPIPSPCEFIEGYDPQLEAVVMRALQRNVLARYQTAREFRLEASDIAADHLGRELPEVPLSALMTGLFADRIVERRAIISKVRRGRPVSRVRIPITASIDIPSDIQQPVATKAVPLGIGGSRRLRSIAAVALVLGTAGVAMAMYEAPSEARAPTLPVLTHRLGANVENIAEPTPEKIALHVITTPPGATVRIADTDRGAAPLTVQLDKRDTPVEMIVQLDGYETIRTELATDQNTTHRLALRRIRTPNTRRRSKPPTPKPADTDGYRKFR